MTEQRAVAPRFLAPSLRLPRAGAGLWAAVMAALLSFLLLAGWAGRDEWARDARLRPWVARLCAIGGCALPAWSEPAAFRIEAREVRADPDRPGVLRVDAAFRNDAREPQPWPCLRVTLTDVAGQPVASGRFTPAQYRDGDARGLIGPGQTASARVHVREPARGAVGYDLRTEACAFSAGPSQAR